MKGDWFIMDSHKHCVLNHFLKQCRQTEPMSVPDIKDFSGLLCKILKNFHVLNSEI